MKRFYQESEWEMSDTQAEIGKPRPRSNRQPPPRTTLRSRSEPVSNHHKGEQRGEQRRKWRNWDRSPFGNEEIYGKLSGENEEREKNWLEKKKKKTLNRGARNNFWFRWRGAEECTVAFHLWKATVTLWVFEEPDTLVLEHFIFIFALHMWR